MSWLARFCARAPLPRDLAAPKLAA